MPSRHLLLLVPLCLLSICTPVFAQMDLFSPNVSLMVEGDPPGVIAEPGTLSLTSGEKLEITLYLDPAGSGLAGYNISMYLGEPGIVEIDQITFPEWAYLSTYQMSGSPPDAVWCKAVDLTGEAGTGNVTLISFTMHALSPGNTMVHLSDQSQIDDRQGSRYPPHMTPVEVVIRPKITPDPTPEPTPTVTPTPVPTVTPDPTPEPTPTVTPTPVPTPTPDPTPEPTPTVTPTPVPTVTPDPTPEPTPTVSPTPVPPVTPELTPEPTPTVTPTPVPTVTPDPTPEPTPTVTPTPVPTVTPDPTPEPTPTVTPTPVPTPTPDPTPEPTPTVTPTPVPTVTPDPTPEPTPTVTPTPVPTPTPRPVIPITDLTVVNTTSGSVDIAWTAPVDAESVDVEMSIDSGKTWAEAGHTPSHADAGVITLEGLDPYTAYQIRLVVHGGYSQGISNIVSFRTDPGYLLKRTFGTFGFFPDQFRDPVGIAVTHAGEIIVADRQNNRVMIFDNEGNPIRSIGSDLYVPVGLSLDAEDGIYLADAGNHRIVILDSTGKFEREIGSRGSAPGELLFPGGVVVNRSGFIYVSDTSNHRIQVFDPDGEFVWSHGSYGSGIWQFRYPQGMTIDPSGTVYIADRENHRIVAVDLSLDFRILGENGSDDARLKRPRDLAWSPEGLLYVSDTDNNRIVAMNLNGDIIRIINNQGPFQVPIISPAGISVDPAGTLYVTDSSLHRVSIITYHGPVALPSPAFTASPRSGYAPLKVRFDDASTGLVTSWHWTFGDGTVKASQNPEKIYFSPGTYTVSLTAGNQGGEATTAQHDFITVHLRGDLNRNGRIDIGDVSHVAFMAAGYVEGMEEVDFNKDGVVDGADAAYISYLYLGMTGLSGGYDK